MILMVEKEIRGGICHAINQYAKANNRYMKEYDKNNEFSYLKYCDVNYLYGWAMSQKLPVNNFEWTEDTSQFNENFVNSYNNESDEGYFLRVVQYLEKLHELHNDLSFLREKMKIEINQRLATNSHGKSEYVIHIRNVRQTFNHGILVKKVFRVVKFNQNAWIKQSMN